MLDYYPNITSIDINENCKKTPSFNILGESPIYCSEHKKDNMINTKNKLCIEIDCKTLANYNYEDEKKPIYCNIQYTGSTHSQVQL